jgi:hypothetical protein
MRVDWTSLASRRRTVRSVRIRINNSGTLDRRQHLSKLAEEVLSVKEYRR